MSVGARSELSLKIGTPRVLGAVLGLSPDLLLEIAHVAGRCYKPFPQGRKRQPFARQPVSQKSRTIDNPTGAVKLVQRRIFQRLLSPLPWPDHIFGGVRGRSLRDNVSLHAGAPVIVTLDITDFFRSVTNLQVYEIWSDLLGCAPQVASLLTCLTTFERRLPLGAATSGALANLLLFSKDLQIRAFCEKHKVVYSNWIDDLAFSGSDGRSVIPVVIEALKQSGFAVSRKKLKVMPGSGVQQLTGLSLNGRISVPREYVSNTRSGIHKLASGMVPPPQLVRYLRKLKGRITYVKSVNPAQARQLIAFAKLSGLKSIR